VSQTRTPVDETRPALGWGKVILLGEHAVVHGKPAIAAGLPRGVRAWARPVDVGSAAGDGRSAAAGACPRAGAAAAGDAGGAGKAGDRLRVMPWGADVAPSSEEPASGDPATERAWTRASELGIIRDNASAHASLRRAFAVLLEALDVDRSVAGLPPRPALSVEAEVALPGGAGLGCSAALGVALVRALDAATGTPRDEAGIIARSLAWERVFHGTPSGIDNTVAVRGGLVWFQRREDGLHVEPLVPRTPLHLVVADTGLAGATRQTVASVQRQLERAPERTQKTLDAIESVVRNGRVAIESGDLRGLGQLFDMNQWLLASLFVSTPELEALCADARRAGALGAKLTGGGGGGCILALAEDAPHAERLAVALRERAREAFVVTVGQAAGPGEGKGAGR
jgi:mevalonate kinase